MGKQKVGLAVLRLFCYNKKGLQQDCLINI